MWFGTKRMERLAKDRLSPVSKPRHINSVFTINTVYILKKLSNYNYIPPHLMNIVHSNMTFIC